MFRRDERSVPRGAARIRYRSAVDRPVDGRAEVSYDELSFDGFLCFFIIFNERIECCLHVDVLSLFQDFRRRHRSSRVVLHAVAV